MRLVALAVSFRSKWNVVCGENEQLCGTCVNAVGLSMREPEFWYGQCVQQAQGILYTKVMRVMCACRSLGQGLAIYALCLGAAAGQPT